MNETLQQMKDMTRAMRSYVYTIWEMVYESNAQNIGEIGTRNFQSTRTILSALAEKGSGLLTSVDISPHASRLTPEMEPYWRFILGDSTKEETRDKVADREYDIFLIDGSHEYDDVKRDFELYFSLVKRGGFMLFHDIANCTCGVPKFYDKLDVPNKISFNWGKAAGGVIPGLGIIQK